MMTPTLPTTAIETRNTIAKRLDHPDAAAGEERLRRNQPGEERHLRRDVGGDLGVGEQLHGAETHVGAEHEELGVREVDHEQDAVDERVAEGDERVHPAQGDAVDQLLNDDV